VVVVTVVGERVVVVVEMEVLVVAVFAVGVLVEVVMEVVSLVQGVAVELVEVVWGVMELWLMVLGVVVEEAAVKITSAPLCVWFWRSTTPKRRATWLCSWSLHRSALFV
jgi:hypothetical protein